MKAGALITVALYCVAALAALVVLFYTASAGAVPPCKNKHARPATCGQYPAGWLCLSPALAADCPAELKAQGARCELEKTAAKAVADSVLRREVGKVEAAKKAVEIKLDIAIGLANKAEKEAAARWTTSQVVAWVAGGVALGAAGGAAVYWLATR